MCRAEDTLSALISTEALMQPRVKVALIAAIAALLLLSASLDRSNGLASPGAGPSVITPTSSVYLAAILRPEVTPLPPTGACAEGAPPPIEDAQAWVTKFDIDAGQDQTLCVRLIRNNQSIAGAMVTAVAHLPGNDAPLGPATTAADGVATIVFNVGPLAKGAVTAVGVDSTVTYDGEPYFATTCFNLYGRLSPQVLACA
jgi:hypothetical protein